MRDNLNTNAILSKTLHSCSKEISSSLFCDLCNDAAGNQLTNKKPLPIRKRFFEELKVWRGRRDLNSRSSA